MFDNAETKPTVLVVVDSTSSLTAGQTRGLPIEVVPLQLTVGGRSYRDGVDITPDEFYRLIQDDAVSAQTAAPSPAAFQSAFERAFAAGLDVLCVTTTAKLSATYDVAAGALASTRAQAPGASAASSSTARRRAGPRP